MAETRATINRPQSASTPPHCAICLGNCMDKCFSDSCIHQFCFQCLVQWSKVKAECPLCKQPFKSIIHNVISNEEYDTHVVEPPRNEDPMLHRLREDYWFLPLPRAQRQQFHVRTTFTVDSTGEHAIQQMLLSSPFAAGTITVDAGIPDLSMSSMDPTRTIYPRHRRDYSATSFRRSIYAQNLWVVHDDHMLGMRYRDCTPTYFRNNPAARHRLVPWLNRELNALLYEDTRLIMQVVDLILDNLANYHICGRTFRNLLHEYFNVKTDHFIHEFYNFMRSPFDMVGYDRNITYHSRPTSSPVPVIEETVEIPDDNSNDSDVVLVETSTEPPVTIDLLDTNTDSDEPVVVSSGYVTCPVPFQETSNHLEILPPSFAVPSSAPSVNLPPKLRYKQQLSAGENRKRKQTRRQHRTRTSSSDSSCSSSSEEYNRKFLHSYKRYKKRKMMRKFMEQQQKKQAEGATSVPGASSSTAGLQIATSESEDEKPLIDLLNAKNKKKKSKKRSRHSEGADQLYPMDLSKPSCSSFSSTITSNHGVYDNRNCTTTLSLSCNLTDNAEPSGSSSRFRVKISRNERRNSNNEDGAGSSGSTTDPYELPPVKSEIRPTPYDGAEPSTSKPLPLVLRRNRDKWYIFDESDTE
ncbi:E3 ubiquitin-protein ligase Topors-like isoform X2 [Anthonomus grandis grandis]|uniref:E3 ubiquitin-protein ligase Topors-like isoform X2 n=1 Tax=Anthonomus grandis grandis TaxID=2921223 RepID=UPI0021662868|nr:E3 ubiquitin-protein ligase Topors-like isoform X2 [Anthonomus grandis grandis]